MAGLFWRQFSALFWKNWIVLFRHPWLNILRCFVAPVGFGVLLAVAQLFLDKPNNFGLGTAVPVKNLADVFDGSLPLVWADGTTHAANPTPSEIMSHMTSDFSAHQMRAVKKLRSPQDIPSACPQNFNLFSDCFAAIIFDSFPLDDNDTRPLNYTILADGGLGYIDVVKHKSDYELRLLPLQWAVDQAIIELKTGIKVPAPIEMPYNTETNDQQMTEIRISFINGVRSLLVLALFVCYIGIAYQLPGAFMGERANLLTSHLKAMGLLDSARILSWHLSLCLAYAPSWIIVSLIWSYRIFTSTNAGLIFIIHFLLGLTLASWSFFIGMPFGKSPHLAAVASTFLSILFAIIALVFKRASTGAAVIYSLIFPPGFYIFAIRAIAGFESNGMPTDASQPDPDDQLRLVPIIIVAVIDVFLWPCLAVLLERCLYDAHNTSFWTLSRKSKAQDTYPLSQGTAISIQNLGKDYQKSMLGRDNLVTAISDLTLDIPKFGIYVLLGSNGAGKSTVMSILGNLLGCSRGTVKFEGNVDRPPRGTIGIVPQKNVLFPELSCYQTLQVWKAVKHMDELVGGDDDIEQLLKDCDLAQKIHHNANTLSGGQKRKLQLAIGLIGGSKIVLVDECTSGVDPLSRRSLWRTLSAVRHERTIVFTTHFLDEADLLADTIAVLAAPGKLVAQGTPVALKSSLGEGYTIDVAFKAHTIEKSAIEQTTELLCRIRRLAPAVYVSSSSAMQATYHLKVKDTPTVQHILQMIEDEKTTFNVASYSVLGSSIEDIFLGLMHDSSTKAEIEQKEADFERTSPTTPYLPLPLKRMSLTTGRRRSPLSQAFTIFHKRWVIFKRNWVAPVLAVAIAVTGCCFPLSFLAQVTNTCSEPIAGPIGFNIFPMSLYLPTSPIGITQKFTGEVLLESPPAIAATLGTTTAGLMVEDIANNATFVDTIQRAFLEQPIGGVSVDLKSNNALFAWEATPPGLTGNIMLNFASNILYNNALNKTERASSTPSLITARYANFPGLPASTLTSLKWFAFFGAAMSVYPAFFSLYVSKERRSSVQAMQFSNGLSNPVGLWLGHLLFDSIFSVISATIITVVFTAVAFRRFHGLGFFWLILVQYGVVGTLFSYVVSLLVASPLAAFALVAGYQVIMFVLYIAAYLLVLTFARPSDANHELTIIHYTLSVLSPVASALRGSFVAGNLFSVLCDGSETFITSSFMGQLPRYGGPILYLVLYGFMLFSILVWVDSGSLIPRRKPAPLSFSSTEDAHWPEDVKSEAIATANSSDTLRMLRVSKSYGSSNGRVVDDVSFGVNKDTVFALLGPNGAGKTVSSKIISGDITPDRGDVLINGMSVVHHLRSTRLSLGVCPQFTAIDSELTVREHLLVYGRLKGLRKGDELNCNVDEVLHATSLHMYANRLANKLSGGNKRKLSLAIALIGNPSCILIDELSTGIDAKMKRDMWKTLRNVAAGKAIIITTHSMEEASALATKVGILAKRMLAIGTTDSLVSRYATYEVHFSCRTREDVLRVQDLMSQIPQSRMADDVATRFEVPVGTHITLPVLFSILSSSRNVPEYTVERASLESVFLKVIRENDVLEEDVGNQRRWRWC